MEVVRYWRIRDHLYSPKYKIDPSTGEKIMSYRAMPINGKNNSELNNENVISSETCQEMVPSMSSK